MRQYTVVLIPDADDGGYTVTVPALPGLVAQGESMDEALAMTREAITFHIECLVEEGEAVPDEGTIVVEHVQIAVA
ncbi:MAG: type II toxin-antitoxin system HicB family antitoxin [Dehalococcoidia bacterium]